MSGAPCKQVLCLANAESAAREAKRQVIRGEYSDDEAELLQVCAENFIKDVMKIAEG